MDNLLKNSLNNCWTNVCDGWKDEHAKNFEEKYIMPLRECLDTIHKLDEEFQEDMRNISKL